MERDPIEEHRRQQEDEEFWRQQDDERATRRPAGMRTTTADPHLTDDAQSPDRPTDVASGRGATARSATAPSSQRLELGSSGMPKRLGMAVAVLAALGALSWMGYRHWFADTTPKTEQLGGLPAPQAGALVLNPAPAPALPATVPEPSTPAPVLSDPVEPQGMAGVPPTDEGASPTPDQATAEQLAAIRARLDALEQRVNEVIEGLKARGYISPTAALDGPLTAQDFLPHPSQARSPAAADQRPSGASVTARRPAPAPVAPPPSQQLLSIDMWNGRPSVVVGHGPGQPSQVRVMEPGDTLGGLTLRSVDVASGSATFVNGQSQPVTLSIAGH